jgi:cell division protein FtsB
MPLSRGGREKAMELLRRGDRAARQVRVAPSRGDSEGPFLRKIPRPSRQQWSRFLLCGFLIWAAYSLLLGPSGTLRYLRLEKEAAQLEEQIARAEATCDSLDQLLAAMDAGSPFLLERIVREEFGFARTNERVYTLPYNPEDQQCLSRAHRYAGETFAERRQREELHDRRAQ